MTKQLKLAFIGCGGIARAHWRGIARHVPEIIVTTCIDENIEAARAFSELTGGRAFQSLDEALRKGDFDAVDIMLPHDLHEPTALACFAADKHVCLEKPLAHTLDSALRILDAAKRHDTVFMIAEQAQYWPDVHKAAALIQAGEIGEVLTARAFFFDPLPARSAPSKPWRFYLDRAGGGISIDGGAHWIRPLRLMLGEISEVLAVTQRQIEDMEGESLAHAIFRFESGLLGTFQALMKPGTTGPIEDFRITGSEGEIIIERGKAGRLMLYNNDFPKGRVIMEDVYSGKVDSFGAELKDFSRAVLNGSALAAMPDYALGELRTAQAMYASANTGTWACVGS